MNIFDRQNIDWESFTGELLWHNVVYHGDEYSGYDIIVNAGPGNVYSQLENPYPRGNKPGDIVRDTSFLSYYIGPVRKLSWKELCIVLMFYKDILLPDHHDCPKCDDYKNCKARFKDDPKQERCNYWSQKYNTTTIYEEYKKFVDDLINNPPKINSSSIDYLSLLEEIYKKTLAYELDKTIVNDDGTITHLHSDKFLEEHPERKDSPEYTEEELKENIDFIANVAKKTAKEWGSLFKEKFDK